MSLRRWMVMMTAMGGVSREINKAAPAITPTLGSELIVNGDMELDASWANSGTPTTNERSSEQAHGGTFSRKAVADAPTEGIVQVGGGIYVVDTWYHGTGWLFVTGGQADINLNNSNVGGGLSTAVTATSTWTQVFFGGKASATSRACSIISRAGTGTFYTDDISVKAVTFSSAHVLLGDIGRKNGTYTCHPTVAKGTEAGIMIEYADENNFVMAVINAVSAWLVKRIGGTYTLVKTGAITYVPGAELKVVVNGTTHQLFYNDAQVSTDGTISDAGLGTEVHAFSTYSGNAVGLVTTNP